MQRTRNAEFDASGTIAEDPYPTAALDPAGTAFFLDFDGTLAAIVDDPATAGLEPEVAAILERISQRSAGALAIVSGRSLAELDRMLAPLTLPAGAVHGMERRSADGRVEHAVFDHGSLQLLHLETMEFVREHPGLVAELKPGSVALHYRKRPELEAGCIHFAERAAVALPGAELLHGKMVIETKLGHRTKGDAIAAFMAEEPFAGRRPLFVGDDVTDEHGFRVLPRWHGISIKIGPGETEARYRLPDRTAFLAWLTNLDHHMGGAKAP